MQTSRSPINSVAILGLFVVNDANFAVSNLSYPTFHSILRAVVTVEPMLLH